MVSICVDVCWIPVIFPLDNLLSIIEPSSLMYTSTMGPLTIRLKCVFLSMVASNSPSKLKYSSSKIHLMILPIFSRHDVIAFPTCANGNFLSEITPFLKILKTEVNVNSEFTQFAPNYQIKL